jgi:hypothetical protein
MTSKSSETEPAAAVILKLSPSAFVTLLPAILSTETTPFASIVTPVTELPVLRLMSL